VSSIKIPSYLNLPGLQDLASLAIIKIPSYLNRPNIEDLAGFSLPGNFSLISINYIN
jgi:hypothetical protein